MFVGLVCFKVNILLQ